MITLKDLYTGGVAPGISQGMQWAGQKQSIDNAKTRNQLAELALQNEPTRIANQNRLADLRIQDTQQSVDQGRQSAAVTNLDLLRRALEGQGPISEIQDDDTANQRYRVAQGLLGQVGVDLTGMPETVTAAELQAVGGMGGAGQNTGVQSTFTTQDGKLGYVTRDGQTVVTDQDVQRSYQARNYGDRPFIFDSKSGQLMPVGGAAGEAALSAADQQRQAELEQARQEAMVKEGAKAAAGAAETERSNTAAYSAYDSGMRALAESLGKTTTGPVAGLLPAFSDDQRIADGAIAAMAPILKQMFRSAGEGTFTDNDQKLLMDMIPTRQDGPAVQKAKFRNIDAIVRAKLGVSEDGTPVAPPQQDGGTQAPGGDAEAKDWSDL